MEGGKEQTDILYGLLERVRTSSYDILHFKGIYASLVTFSVNVSSYMFRGTLQFITISAPLKSAS